MTLYIAKKDFDRWLKATNKMGVWVEDIRRHLEPADIKGVSGLANTRGVLLVLVDEDGRAKGLAENRTLRYNSEYRRWNGDAPLYGNAVMVLSDKAYATLAPEKKTPMESVAFA